MTSFVGYPSSYRAPFTAMQILFNQGPSNAPSGPRSALYVGPKTASGTALVNTVYQIDTELDAITLFGPGSPLHRAIKIHLLSNTFGGLFAMCYAASSGSGVASATGTFTIGGAPTATGNVTGVHCGELITTSFTTLDTPTTIAAAHAAQVNAKTWLPYTATPVAGVITLTAKTAGSSQGDGTIGVLRFHATVDPGKGVTVAQSATALGITPGVAGADGATTELANLTAALAVVSGVRYYYIGCTVWSAAQIAPVVLHNFTKSQTNPGLRSRSFSGFTGSGSACSTIAVTQNYERHHVCHQVNSEWDPAYLVGNVIATHQKAEAAIGGFVHDNYRDKDWLCPAAFATSDWPSATAINSAVTDGIIEVASDQFGSYMVMSVTTRSRDSGGTLADFRSTETHRISFMDAVGDRWVQRHVVQYGTGFKLQADALLPDGTINRSQRLPPRTLTPSDYKPFAGSQLQEGLDNGELQGSQWLDSLATSVDALNTGRLVATASGRTTDILHQAAVQLSETTPG